MDLKLYYNKIRETEAKIPDAFPVLVSVETADGGKAGTYTEVTRNVGAKMIVDGMAQMAAPEEAQRFREQQADAKRLADDTAAAARIQVTVLSPAEYNRLKGGQRSSKDQA